MAKRFKKGSIEAKRFMAKIRLKKGKPKSLGAKSKIINHYVVNGKFFIDYMDAVNYADNNNLSYNKIKKTKNFQKQFTIKQKKNVNDLGALAPINKSEQTVSFVPKTITENQILKEINKVKEEILHLLAMQKEHILKGHKRSLGALVKNKQNEIGNLLKKCK